MKTKNLFRLFFTGALAVLVLSCAQKEQAVKGYNVAGFSAEITEIAATTVTAKVTVTENDDAPWYAFITTDLSGEADEIVSEKVGELTVSKKILKTGTDEVTLTGLIPGGYHYRLIVTGLAPDGRTYGTPIDIPFRTGMDFSESENWKAEFLGTSVEEGELVNYFEISGTERKLEDGTTETDLFSYIVVPADAYAERGAEEIISADVEAVLAAEAADDYTFSGDDYYTWDELAAGDYVLVMYGVDEAFNPTLEYLAYEFTVEGTSELYESFLGNWFTEVGDMYTIEPETINQTFYFSGLPAFFNPEGAIVFQLANLGGGVYVVGVKEDGSVVTSGVFGYGIISEDGETISFVGNTGIVKITAMGYTGSGWVETGNAVLELPVVLSSTAPEPSEEYAAWLGTWYTESGEACEFSQDIINNTSSVKGFFGDTEVTVPFDKASGNVLFTSDDEYSKDDTYEYFFAGWDNWGYHKYVEFGDENDLLATGTIAEDGESFGITGNVYVSYYGYDEELLEIGVFATANWSSYDMADGAVFIELPATLYRKVPAPSEEYLAWIGQWSVSRADDVIDTWTFSEKKMNTSYTITGIEGTSFEVDASFDKATGAITVAEQDVYSITGADDSNVVTMSLYGNIVFYGETYFWGADADIFSAGITEEGTATITPYEAIDSYYGDNYGPFSAFGFYATIGDPDNYNIAPVSDVRTALPNTMTKLEEESGTSLSLPVSADQWSNSAAKRFPLRERVSAKSADSKGAKTKGVKTLKAEKQAKTHPGEAPKTSKAGNKNVKFGGGNRGKLNK